VAAAAPRLLVLEGIADQENLGALFRNAAALGAGGVLLDPRCADPLYRRSVRVSLGNVLAVPFARAEPWPQVLEELAADGVDVVALTPAAAGTLASAGLHRAERLALVVGAEGPGLSAGALGACPRQVRIPMAAGVDSLNVATAAAVALHAALRPDGAG
jgi:tRNA G18 (ribose-2'-O)-methylase SpoU